MTRNLASVVALVLALAAATTASAADWPQYRGPRRDGVSLETGLARSWPAAGPREVWRVGIGAGYSGIAIDGGRLYTAYSQGDRDVLAAHDAATGKSLWTVDLGPQHRDGQGNGPRATPTVDGDLVYAASAGGRLMAVEAASGKVAWQKDLVGEYQAEPPQWGISAQPVVEDDLLIFDVGGPRAGVVAFDKRSGAERWRAEGGLAGYSQPVRLTVGDSDQLVVFRGRELVALVPATGKTLWRQPWKTDWDVNAATPIFVPPNRLFVSTGYSTGSALLEIPAGAGSPRELWASKTLENQFSSSVLRNGTVYGFDNKVLKAINLTTGAEWWKQSGLGHGSLLWADGMLYVLSERGKLVLVEATPESYRELASAEPLSGKCWTAPTLVDGKLYLRNEKEMVCLDVTAAPAS